MNCDRTRDLASDALDGALDARRSEEYFHHLRVCPPCLTFHEELRQSLALLEELPVVDVQDGFEDRVWRRLAQEGLTGTESAAYRPRLDVRLREWFSTWTGASFGWERWSLAGVAAGVFALALVSPDPAPRSSIVGASASSSVASSDADLARSPSTELTSRVSSNVAAPPAASLVSQEDEFVAEMPEAVREYLRHAKDLRLPVGEDQYRRSNYSYPVRRVVNPSPLQLTGESTAPVSPTGAGDATVIAF